MIVFKDVSKSYKTTTVLKDISFTIEDGDLVCLIGESGCGKTTTLKMINKLISPTSGEITINKQNIKNINDVKLRRKMGYVIQQTGLFSHMTIRENIEIIAKIEKMPEQKRSKRVKEMMDMVGLDEKLLERYPNELSGGQLQRIGIARAFMTDPKIILMDEPTSALDPIATLKIEELINELKKEYTIVIVTHNMQQATRVSDYTAFFMLGEIVEYNKTGELFKSPKNKKTEDYITGRFG